jgi:hypothetical protein
LVLKKINDRLDIDKVFSNETILEAKASYRGATNTMGSSLPNEEKEKYKSIVKSHIQDSNKYDEVVELYKSIINQ